MNPEPSSVPILLLLWIRDEFIDSQILALSAIQPTKIFVSIDGPRSDNPHDQSSIQRILDSISSNICWECQIFIQRHEQNMGLRNAVEAGLDWFFAHVTEGIILEDDIIPSASFFTYCARLLHDYRDANNIFSISGDARSSIGNRAIAPYHSSSFFFCWGWATWSTKWKNYRSFDFKMIDFFALPTLSITKKQISHLKKIYVALNSNQLDSWAYKVFIYCIYKNNFQINPNENLISNIGNDRKSTHTMTREQPLVASKSIAYDYINIQSILPPHVYEYDRAIYRSLYQPKSFLSKILLKILYLKRKILI